VFCHQRPTHPRLGDPSNAAISPASYPGAKKRERTPGLGEDRRNINTGIEGHGLNNHNIHAIYRLIMPHHQSCGGKSFRQDVIQYQDPLAISVLTRQTPSSIHAGKSTISASLGGERTMDVKDKRVCRRRQLKAVGADRGSLRALLEACLVNSRRHFSSHPTFCCSEVFLPP